MSRAYLLVIGIKIRTLLYYDYEMCILFWFYIVFNTITLSNCYCYCFCMNTKCQIEHTVTKGTPAFCQSAIGRFHCNNFHCFRSRIVQTIHLYWIYFTFRCISCSLNDLLEKMTYIFRLFWQLIDWFMVSRQKKSIFYKKFQQHLHRLRMIWWNDNQQMNQIGAYSIEYRWFIPITDVWDGMAAEKFENSVEI